MSWTWSNIINGEGGLSVRDKLNNAINWLYTNATSIVTYTITFYVENTDSVPIQGATINYAGKSATTNASGLATISAEDGTTANATIAAQHYVTKTISVTADGDKQVDVEMETRLYDVSIRVRKVGTNTAIHPAAVTVVSTDGGGINETDDVNVQGNVTFNLPAGSYDVTVVAAGYEDDTSPIVVNGNQITNIGLTPTGHTVTLTCKDAATDDPITSGTLSFNQQNYNIPANGILVIEGVTAGYYIIQSKPPGYEMLTDDISVPDQTAKTLLFEQELDRHSVTVNVYDAGTDAPLSGTMNLHIGGFTRPVNFTGGQHIFPTVPVGQHLLSVSVPGYTHGGGGGGNWITPLLIVNVVDDDVVFNVPMHAQTYKATFTLQDVENLTGVNAGWIQIHGPQNHVEGKHFDGEGSPTHDVEFTGLVNGEYWYSVDHFETGQSYTGTFTIDNANATITVDLVTRNMRGGVSVVTSASKSVTEAGLLLFRPTTLEEHVSADLPDPTGVIGEEMHFRKGFADTYALTIYAQNDEDIILDDANGSDLTATEKGSWVILVSDGTNWNVVMHYGDWTIGT